jgi:hypothetical protein
MYNTSVPTVKKAHCLHYKALSVNAIQDNNR